MALREEPKLVEGEDYYLEGKAMVFTARFHLRRGYCCESGCRHCPYKSGAAKRAETQFNGKVCETEKDS